MERPASDPEVDAQVERLLDIISDVLGADVVGAYLFALRSLGA